MSFDLFGRPLPKRFGRIPGVQLQAFGGAEWIGAAQDFARDLGLPVERLEAGRRVLCGGRWYAVAWNDTTDQWEILPC
ncbi:MAG: hypothetical protein ACJ8F7_20095 [Gemmataceae bacterium]